MNKSKVIHLAAYSLGFLLLAFIIFRLFALGADLGLQQAELRENTNQLGNLLQIDINKISSLQLSSRQGDVFLLNVQEKIADWEKKEYKLYLNREITQVIDDEIVKSHGIRWQLVEPSVIKVDQKLIERLLNTISKLPFYSVSVANSEEQLAKFGLLQPQLVIKCVFSNRQETEMQVGIASKADPNRYYLRFKNSTVVFTVGPEIKCFFVSKLSLVDREIGANKLDVNLDFFSFVRASDSFYLDAYKNNPTTLWYPQVPNSGQLERSLRWYSYRPFYNLLNQTIAREIVENFATLRAFDCIDEITPSSNNYSAQMEQYGFDKPSFILRMGEHTGKIWELIAGKQIGDFYYVKITDNPYVYLVEQRLFNTLLLPNYQYLRSKPFDFSRHSLVSFVYKDNRRQLQVNFPEAKLINDTTKVYGNLVDTLPYYTQLQKLSVAPLLPANNKQFVLTEYQQRIYAKEMSYGDNDIIWPNNCQLSWQKLTDKENAKSSDLLFETITIQSDGEAGKQCRGLFKQLFKVLQNVHASDLAWQTVFLDKNSEANYELKFVFKNGQELHFTLYEANFNSYYLYINGSFSHYVIHKDSLVGGAKTDHLAQITDKLDKLLTKLKQDKQS